SYRYHPETGRCVKAWGDGGLHGFEFTYDLTEGTTTAHANPEPRVFTWNAYGAVVKEATYDGEMVEETVYDDDLLVIAEKNAAGEAMEYELDTRGNKVREVDGAGNVTTWEIEGDREVSRTDPDGLVRRYSFDGRGALVGFTQPSGVSYSLSYDGRGLL